MARQARIVIPEQPMHIMHRGNNRQDIFLNDEDRLRFLADMAISLEETGCALHAYVLMTNHFHLLLTPPSQEVLSRFMQSIGRRYVRYFNQRNKRSGTLWEGRYKSCLIDSDAYLLSCYRYIETNPVRAGMVNSPEEYPWSSYHYNALANDNALITEHKNYSQLANEKAHRNEIYKGLFTNVSADNEDFQLLTQSMDKEEAIGGKLFIAMVEGSTGLKVRRGQHGGDRKSDDYKTSQISK